VNREFVAGLPAGDEVLLNEDTLITFQYTQRPVPETLLKRNFVEEIFVEIFFRRFFSSTKCHNQRCGWKEQQKGSNTNVLLPFYMALCRNIISIS